MNKQILEIIEKLKGSLLGIGLSDENILDAIENNENIQTCYLLNNLSLTGKRFSITKHGKEKKINIKKIKKQFKKKSLDNIVCNFDIIKQFYRSFVPNSIYLCNKTIYIYGRKQDLEKIKAKYQRYTEKIEIEENEDNCVMKIDVQNTKNYFFKDTSYKITDFATDAIDVITDILIN